MLAHPRGCIVEGEGPYVIQCSGQLDWGEASLADRLLHGRAPAFRLRRTIPTMKHHQEHIPRQFLTNRVSLEETNYRQDKVYVKARAFRARRHVQGRLTTSRLAAPSRPPPRLAQTSRKQIMSSGRAPRRLRGDGRGFSSRASTRSLRLGRASSAWGARFGRAPAY